jgi:UDP-perosamine 4-acetyltransferase
MKSPEIQQPGIIGMGAGGHCRVVIDLIRQLGCWHIEGVLDSDTSLHGGCLDGIPILGGDSLANHLHDQGIISAFLGVGSIGNPGTRTRIFRSLCDLGFDFPALVHPKALVAGAVTVGPASCVMQGSIINPGSTVGNAAIINSGAVVEHDCVVGDFSHISPGALLGGGVIVGMNSHVGMGAIIRQGIRIGRNVLVGAGAVVVADVPDGTTVLGIPARPVPPTNTSAS